MAMKSIKTLKSITPKGVKTPKMTMVRLSGMKTSVTRPKGKSVKKF